MLHRLVVSGGIVALSLLGAGLGETRQPVPIAPARQAPARAQSGPEKKLAAIMKSDGTKADDARRIRELEQFIRDNPTFERLEAVYANLLTFLTIDTSNPAKTIAIA